MREFATSLHDMLSAADVPKVARQWADGDRAPGLALWRRLADLGVTALAVPEKWGGLGADPADIVAACVELGHHALPGPVAESLAAVPALLAALADGDSRGGWPGDAGSSGEWLAGLAAGDLIGTLAMPPRLPFAADADAAGLVLRADGGVVCLARPGTRNRSVDPARAPRDDPAPRTRRPGPAGSRRARPISPAPRAR